MLKAKPQKGRGLWLLPAGVEYNTAKATETKKQPKEAPKHDRKTINL